MGCEKCGSEVDELDGVCTGCGWHRYPYILERGQVEADGSVEVMRCNVKPCLTDDHFCKHLMQLLPVDETLVIVFCNPVYRGAVES